MEKWKEGLTPKQINDIELAMKKNSLIQPGDIRIKKNTEERHRLNKKYPERNWKTNLSQEQIDEVIKNKSI